jgi:hypothetical protein
MKVIAITTGAFQLLDSLTGDLISAFRPSVVEKTSFLTARHAIDQVKVLAEVADSATDDEFAKHWHEAGKDIDLAVQSFTAIHSLVAAAAPEADPAPAKKSAKKATE